jgi:hypothetical protein
MLSDKIMMLNKIKMHYVKFILLAQGKRLFLQVLTIWLKLCHDCAIIMTKVQVKFDLRNLNMNWLIDFVALR